MNCGDELKMADQILREMANGLFPITVRDYTPTSIDELSGITYLGYAKSTDKSDASWYIVKIVENGGETDFYVPELQVGFNQIWDNRAALTYVLKTV